MIISEFMSSSVYVASPDDTLQSAAQSMIDLDTGVPPVGEGDHAAGIEMRAKDNRSTAA